MKCSMHLIWGPLLPSAKSSMLDDKSSKLDGRKVIIGCRHNSSISPASPPLPLQAGEAPLTAYCPILRY